ncbi:MAG: dephospho-CoA kinase [Spirochaetes bacterium]|nr:dephospho-CoA kinase [Spirochaetota bacterium]
MGNDLDVLPQNIIGLTGLYCSGKSTIAKILKDKYGFFIIDIDKIGHQALEEKKDEIIKAFGKLILNNNKIDRKKLGYIVFKKKQKLKLLDSIVHPLMIKRVKEIINNTKEKKICINAALLLEMKLDWLCKIIIITKSSFFNIIKRAKKRDDYSILQVLKIISSQKVFKLVKKYKYNADIFYVYNNKNIDYLENQIKNKRDLL